MKTIEMSDADLETMCKALGLSKTKEYRPYCISRTCREMPRMELREYGFECPSCRNRIGFNLVRVTTTREVMK